MYETYEFRIGFRHEYVIYYSINNETRRLRWAGHVPRMEEGRSAFKILTDTTAEKRP